MRTNVTYPRLGLGLGLGVFLYYYYYYWRAKPNWTRQPGEPRTYGGWRQPDDRPLGGETRRESARSTGVPFLSGVLFVCSACRGAGPLSSSPRARARRPHVFNAARRWLTACFSNLN